MPDPRIGRRGVDGLVTVGISGGCPKLPPPSDECRVLQLGWNPFWSTYGCGHRAPRSFRLRVYGVDSGWMSKTAQCPDCHLKMVIDQTIFCCFCDLPILPGDAIALYSLDNTGITARATKIEIPGSGPDGIFGYIGCLRRGCGTGADFAGHWMGKGFLAMNFEASP